MYKALYDPATLPSSVVSVPSPILFLVYSILATTLASLVEHTNMLLPQGLCSYCSLWLGYLLPRIHITSSEHPHFFQEHCSNVFWWKRLILFDLKALSKTASLPSYHSLSYLHTLFLFLFCFFLFLIALISIWWILFVYLLSVHSAGQDLFLFCSQ